MKWFFITVLMSAGVLVNLVVVTDIVLSRIPGLAVFDIAFAGVAWIWYGAYFESNVINANSEELGLALLLISVGMFLVLTGVGAVLSDSCEVFFSGERHLGWRNALVRMIESSGSCKEAGYMVAFFGICFAVFPARIVLRIARGAHS
jgi:hypothetical protein